jgi:RecA/RadA recombinase
MSAAWLKTVRETGKEMSKKQIAELTHLINQHLNTGLPKGEQKTDFVISAEKSQTPFILRRPTGIISIDLALKGGWPAGGISEIAGQEGVGKNALCWQTIYEVQKIYGEDSCIGWCWTEYPIDKSFGQLFGAVVPMSDKEIKIENTARKRMGLRKLSPAEIKMRKRSLGEFIIIDKGNTEKRFDALVEMVRSNLFQIIVVDSVAAVLTEVQDSASLEEEPQQSSEARLITRLQQKLWGAYQTPTYGDVNSTTILVINQARANRSTAKYKKAWKVGGAFALRHGKLTALLLERGSEIPKDKTKTKEGNEIKWNLSKGKARCHDGPRGVIKYFYHTGYNLYEDLVHTAKRVGLLTKSGKLYTLVNNDGEVIEHLEGGTEGIIKRAIMDTKWAEALYKSILTKEGIVCLYRLDSE